MSWVYVRDRSVFQLQSIIGTVQAVRSDGIVAEPLMYRALLAIAVVAVTLALSGLGLGFWGPQTYVETEDGKPGWVSFGDRVQMISRSAVRGINPLQSCGHSFGDKLKPPLDGEAELGFGVNKHHLLRQLRHHAGVDFERPSGTPVRASAAGRVSFAHQSGFYGTLVILSHDASFQTLYAHLSSTLVSYGQCVAAGDVIGLVGSTGLSSTPHLHFEIRKDDVAVDPEDWVPELTIN